MWTVRYYLLGEWYELGFCDYSSARAFAVGFLEWHIVNPQMDPNLPPPEPPPPKLNDWELECPF